MGRPMYAASGDIQVMGDATRVVEGTRIYRVALSVDLSVRIGKAQIYDLIRRVIAWNDMKMCPCPYRIHWERSGKLVLFSFEEEVDQDAQLAN